MIKKKRKEFIDVCDKNYFEVGFEGIDCDIFKVFAECYMYHIPAVVDIFRGFITSRLMMLSRELTM